MKKLILGILIMVISYALEFSGIGTYVSTQAALNTVNGGGLEYQISRSVSGMILVTTILYFVGSALIGSGIVTILLSPKKQKQA